MTEDDVRYSFTKLDLANLKNSIQIKEKHEASAGYSEKLLVVQNNT
jgi:hypothetical protein